MRKEYSDPLRIPISGSELEAFLKLYNIGKKPLAALLGWGETAIIQLLKDDIPANESTFRLKALFDDPTLYADLLLSGSGRLSPVAFKKSLKALQGLFPLTKVTEAARYVCSYPERTQYPQTEAVSPLRAETILFWSQVISVCIYDSALFEDDYQPGKSGMPYRSVEELMSRYGCIRPEGIYPVDNKCTPAQNEKEILDSVADSFSWYGEKAMYSIMEAERFRLCGPRGAHRRKTVSREIIRRCYTEVFEQAKVRKLRDFENYLHKRMNYLTRGKSTPDSSVTVPGSAGSSLS